MSGETLFIVLYHGRGHHSETLSQSSLGLSASSYEATVGTPPLGPASDFEDCFQYVNFGGQIQTTAEARATYPRATPDHIRQPFLRDEQVELMLEPQGIFIHMYGRTNSLINHI